MSLTDYKPQLPPIHLERIPFGPWRGAAQAISAEILSREYIAVASGISTVDSSDFLYLPRTGTWKRRQGTTIKFDTLSGTSEVTGLLPAAWDTNSHAIAKCRHLDEFKSTSLTSDNVPSLCALVTSETINSSYLDDGRFSNVYVRNQVGSANYTLGSEFGDDVYPDPGTVQAYRVVPLWYGSGEGGITRGATEFQRRFFVPGSRRMLKVGNWRYFPSYHGTPARWNEEKAATSGTLTISGDITTPDTAGWESIGLATNTACVATDDGATSYISSAQSVVGTYDVDMALSGTVADAGPYTINFTARRTGPLATGPGFGTKLTFTLVNSAGVRSDAAAQGGEMTDPDGTLTLSFVPYTVTISGAFTGSTGQTANSIRVTHQYEANPGDRLDITLITITSGSTSTPLRLIPSGPLPPLHAGTIAVGGAAGTVTDTLRPDADDTDGGWTPSTGTDLYAVIDESTTDDADYMSATTNTTAKIRLSNFTTAVPSTDDTVSFVWRAKKSSFVVTPVLTVSLLEGSNVRASRAANLATNFSDHSLTLTGPEIDSVTDWTNLYLQFTTTSVVAATVYVSQAYVLFTDADVGEGVWRGKDRFLYSIAYRFEDGSVWMPCIPRLPNIVLATGYNMFTVNSASPNAGYTSLTWSNFPKPPAGVTHYLLLRTPKVDSSSGTQSLDLNPFDLRLVAEVDVNATSYEDTFASDYALQPDSAALFIRQDHIMPPAARYIFGGDMRVCHSYGKQDPAAIILAPVGFTAEYDRNLADTSSTIYGSSSFQFWIDYTSGSEKLVLRSYTGGVGSTTDFAFSSYTTLQALVDGINATGLTDNCKQWRAQLAPGVNPGAPTATALTPHYRPLTSCTVTSGTATITRAAGGLTAIPVGARVSTAGNHFATADYVLRVVSDTELTMSATQAVGSGSTTVNFETYTGDDSTGVNYAQRAYANSLPSFIYFNKTYLLPTVAGNKATTWMTTSSPGSNKSAANNFSGKEANRFQPPGNPGIATGGGGVEQGFVITYGNAVYAIRNLRDTGSGIDEEYRLVAINESRGCCAWNTVVTGNQFISYLTSEGVAAADLGREILLSELAFLHAPSASGALTYEVPLCIAATAADDDTAYASAKVMRSALWLSYRASGSHPNRQLVYDFSSGHEASGLAALLNGGKPWGWSVPLIRSVTAMTEGRRSDGSHLYGWNEANLGTGDGRIDEMETGTTDNSVAITALLVFPWERMGRKQKLSAQEFTIEHSAVSGASTFLDVYRGFSATSATAVTLSTTTNVVGREVKLLPQAARVPADAVLLVYRQTAGTSSEIRSLELRAKALPSYT